MLGYSPPMSEARETTGVDRLGIVRRDCALPSVDNITDNTVDSSSTKHCSSQQGNVRDGTLIQQLTKLVQTQTATMTAQTRAMSAQSLLLIPTYSGEGEQIIEDSFERWIDQFEERAKQTTSIDIT